MTTSGMGASPPGTAIKNESLRQRIPLFFIKLALCDAIYQDAEKDRQQRSRIIQTLNVPQRVRLGPSLAAALLGNLFEHPAEVFSCCATRADHRNFSVPK
jgi:hypothetical protein